MRNTAGDFFKAMAFGAFISAIGMISLIVYLFYMILSGQG